MTAIAIAIIVGAIIWLLLTFLGIILNLVWRVLQVVLGFLFSPNIRWFTFGFLLVVVWRFA